MPGDDEDFLEPIPAGGEDEDELQGLPEDDDVGDDDEDNQSGDDGGGEHSSEAGDAGDGRGSGEGLGSVKRSRGEARVENATRIAAEAKARAEALERELAEIRRTSQSQSERDRQERERQALENMDPLERLDYQRRNDAARLENHIGRLEQTIADSNDRAAFAALCARDPRIAKVADEVEAALAGSRANGVMVPRETVAAYIIGQKLMSGAPKARAKQAANGAANVRRAQARPGTGGSDVSSRAAKDEKAARNERLRDALI